MQTGDITALRGILNHLPANIREALAAYAADTGMPIEFIIEMAIVSFLDVDSTTFADCRTDSPGRLRERIEMLEIQLAAAKGQLL
ncbi:hypothetical protein [Argonema antarcticum]|uniref:hypothetical protein n=1 Tax=Argonema antarcticum TaxID=2942763 RepID=UPI00201374C6|nr:hypothetical protein [Argonema antarcticum]MCL1472925.1 hypothetical protein [Argonema antarcticum A004/B2]